MPGLLVDAGTGSTELGAGAGGMSGPALKPSGLRAVEAARAATPVPILGVGGVLGPADAVAYARVGAQLVQVGTATFAAPRAAEQLVRGLERWGRRHRIGSWDDLVAGTGFEPTSEDPRAADSQAGARGVGAARREEMA